MGTDQEEHGHRQGSVGHVGIPTTQLDNFGNGGADSLPGKTACASSSGIKCWGRSSNRLGGGAVHLGSRGSRGATPGEEAVVKLTKAFYGPSTRPESGMRAWFKFKRSLKTDGRKRKPIVVSFGFFDDETHERIAVSGMHVDDFVIGGRDDHPKLVAAKSCNNVSTSESQKKQNSTLPGVIFARPTRASTGTRRIMSPSGCKKSPSTSSRPGR